jgi:hypothetical protein
MGGEIQWNAQVICMMRITNQPPQMYDLARPHIAIFDITMLLKPIPLALGAQSAGFKLLPASTSSKQFCRGNFDKHRFLPDVLSPILRCE